MTIKFGTDGWRGIIAEDFTFDNVRICAQAVASYLQKRGLAERGLVLGYDTRFSSEDFAAAVAEVSAANGVKTFLSTKAVPTPVLAYNVVARGVAGGVVITASHNPARWNGFKYKPEYGGSASPEVVAALEEIIAHIQGHGGVKRLSLEEASKSSMVQKVETEFLYKEHLHRLVDMESLGKAGLKVVVDSMYGAGAGYLREFLSGSSAQVTELNGERNPFFPGISQPEPVMHNLQGLSSAVVSKKADVGLALDCDADRLGVIDEKGRFITPLQVFALLALYLLEVRGQRGAMVKSVTSTSMLYGLGKLYNVPVLETPVGFKYIGPIMIRDNALIGGEESGGFGFRGHIPERDGILSGLYFLDLMVRTGKSPSELLDYLFSKVGAHHYQRVDISFAPGQRQKVEERLRSVKPKMMGDVRVASQDTTDGLRFIQEDRSWVLVRFSGTEPLLRAYAEAQSMEQVQRLLEDIRSLAGV